MKKILNVTAVLCGALILSGCASIGGPSRNRTRNTFFREDAEATKPENQLTEGDPGQKVLKTGESLTLVQKKIIKGSCWDFVNAVFNEAGYPEGKRYTLFQGAVKGPYADPELLRPGDWVMHVNLEFNGVEHSSIFVRWTDRGRHIAKVLDYAGMDREQPGGYDEHIYTKIFCIVRAGEKKQ